jgi:hypothetical protein
MKESPPQPLYILEVPLPSGPVRVRLQKISPETGEVMETKSGPVFSSKLDPTPGRIAVGKMFFVQAKKGHAADRSSTVNRITDNGNKTYTLYMASGSIYQLEILNSDTTETKPKNALARIASIGRWLQSGAANIFQPKKQE